MKTAKIYLRLLSALVVLVLIYGAYTETGICTAVLLFYMFWRMVDYDAALRKKERHES